MTILENIQAARKQALIDKDAAKRTTLGTLIGEIDTFEKREGRQATDKEVVKILTRFRNDANDMIHRVGEQEAAGFMAEIDLYESFIPEAKPQLSAEALHRVVRSVIASRIAGDCAKPKMGQVIADVKVLHEGEYDPKALTPLVKAELEATADPDAK